MRSIKCLSAANRGGHCHSNRKPSILFCIYWETEGHDAVAAIVDGPTDGGAGKRHEVFGSAPRALSRDFLPFQRMRTALLATTISLHPNHPLPQLPLPERVSLSVWCRVASRFVD